VRCRDANYACQQWAAQGYCSKKLYYYYMTTNCCASCRRQLLKSNGAGPAGGTAPKIVAPAKAVAPAVAKPVAPVVVAKPVAPVVVAKPVAPVAPVAPVVPAVDIAAINAKAVAAAEAQKKQDDIAKLLAEAIQAAKDAKAAADAAKKSAEAVEAAKAVQDLNKNAQPAPAAAKPAPAAAKPAPVADVKNKGNTAGPSNTPVGNADLINQILALLKANQANNQGKSGQIRDLPIGVLEHAPAVYMNRIHKALLKKQRLGN